MDESTEATVVEDVAVADELMTDMAFVGDEVVAAVLAGETVEGIPDDIRASILQALEPRVSPVTGEPLSRWGRRLIEVGVAALEVPKGLSAKVATEALIVYEGKDGKFVVRVGADRVAAARKDGTETLAAELQALTSEGREALDVSPWLLTIGDNARKQVEVAEDAAFVGDVGERGVREAIAARLARTGGIGVHKGQRRTLAARLTRRALVPIDVETVTGTGKRRQIADLVDQLGENVHRREMTPEDLADASLTLFDLGASERTIARARRIREDDVRHEVAIARSATARRAMREQQLSMEQLFAIAQVDEYDADLAERLREVARSQPYDFSYCHQELLGLARWRNLAAAKVAELKAEGVEAFLQPTDGDDWPGVPLYEMRATPESPVGLQLTSEEHAECPGRAVMVLEGHVPEQRDGDEPYELELEHICLDPGAHGHTEVDAPPGAAAYEVGPSEAGMPPGEEGATQAGTTTTATTTAEEAARKAEAAEEAARKAAAKKAEEKAWRAKVIKLNKGMAVENDERRAWLREKLLTLEAFGPGAKKFPDGVLAWATAEVLGGGHRFAAAGTAGHPIGHQLLGLDQRHRTAGNPLSQRGAKASGTEYVRVMVAAALGSHEETFNRETWRYGGWSEQEYLRQLQRWGYEVREAGQELLDKPLKSWERPNASEDDSDEQLEETASDEEPDEDRSTEAPEAEEEPSPDE